MSEFQSPETRYYFERFGFCPRQILEPPRDDLGMAVVIPCFAEPHLIAALESLWNCERPRGAVEVIVVLNAGADATPDTLARNEQTLREAAAWMATRADDSFRLYFLDFPRLPPKKAGVGLARKIGMDEALWRFDAIGRLEGVILCLDADCQCDRDYLSAVERHFGAHPRTPGASLYFEHPLRGPEDERVYEAVTRYELHLRYYVEGLRWAGFPHAFHTIGSSMAVRARAYRMQGGMNTRQAGEDFYFLHKIIPLGGFTEINGTRVIPSPRPSDRVPFGTGRAVREFLEGRPFETYPIEAFLDLRELFGAAGELHERGSSLSPPASIREFLDKGNFSAALEEIRRHTTNPESFRKRFFRWFDGFRVMKYIHFARDHFYGPAEITAAAGELWRLISRDNPAGAGDPREWLDLFRKRQRAGGHQSTTEPSFSK